MDKEISAGSEPKVRRPYSVWVISIFYVIGAVWTILSYVLVYSGFLPVGSRQAAYFHSITTVEHILSLLIMIFNLAGAVYLFRLDRRAFVSFLAAFILGLLMTVYLILFKNWLAAVGFGVVGVLFGWGISIVVILYTRHLTKDGTLK